MPSSLNKDIIIAIIIMVPFRTSVLSILPKMWSSASALPSCFDCQRSEVQLPHVCPARTSKGLKLRFRTSTLPWMPNTWSSAFQTSVLPGLHKISSSASALVRPGVPKMWRSTPALHLCREFQRCEVQFRTSALSLLPTIWSSASPLTKCLKFRFRTSALPWLPRSWSSASLFHHSPRCEVTLPHFCFALTAKDMQICFLSSAVSSYAMKH